MSKSSPTETVDECQLKRCWAVVEWMTVWRVPLALLFKASSVLYLCTLIHLFSNSTERTRLLNQISTLITNITHYRVIVSNAPFGFFHHNHQHSMANQQRLNYGNEDETICACVCNRNTCCCCYRVFSRWSTQQRQLCLFTVIPFHYSNFYQIARYIYYTE